MILTAAAEAASNFPIDGWWRAIGFAISGGALLGAVIALVNSWGPS